MGKAPHPDTTRADPTRADTTRADPAQAVLLQRIVRCRRLRAELFGEGLFADPAWDMLLDLAAARAARKHVSITALCIASGVPTTTALRWIRLLEQAGLVLRAEDPTDRRRSHVSLTDKAAGAMARYLAEASRMPA